MRVPRQRVHRFSVAKPSAGEQAKWESAVAVLSAAPPRSSAAAPPALSEQLQRGRGSHRERAGASDDEASELGGAGRGEDHPPVSANRTATTGLLRDGNRDHTQRGPGVGEEGASGCTQRETE